MLQIPASLVFCLSLLAPTQEAPRLEVPAKGNPLASTAEGLFPFPSRFFQAPDSGTATGKRTAYPADVIRTPKGVRAVDFSVFNFADGHPPAAPILVHLGVDVDARFLVDRDDTQRSLIAGTPIALIDVERRELVPLLVEMDQNMRTADHDGRHALILRPLVPLRMGAQHAAVLMDSLRDSEGRPLEAPPGFRALRDEIPTDRSELEAAREDYEQLFAALSDVGYEREKIVLAFDFVVASEESVLGSILSMREQTLDLCEGSGLGYEIEEITTDPNEHVALMVEGRFEVPCFLTQDDLLARRPDSSVALQDKTRWYPFTMLIPPQARDGEPLPLVLFGHGIFGTGRRYLSGGIGRDLIQPLSHKGGAVVIATDWIGLSGNDRDLVGELVRDLNRIHKLTDRLQQALINNLVLVELAVGGLQADERLKLGTGPLLDPERIHYYGVSLGGIQGISTLALSRRIKRAFLAVPGGAWSTLLSRSIVFRPFKMVIDTLYPDPLMQQAYIAMLQARFDGSDGINLGQLIFRRPLPGAPSDRRLVLLEAIGDCQVPNLTTRMVARAIGAKQLGPSVEPVFGLESVEGPTSEPVLAQLLMPERVAKYMPPEGNLLPNRENGTHSKAVRLEPVTRQLLELLETGFVEQFCEEACDPD